MTVYNSPRCSCCGRALPPAWPANMGSEFAPSRAMEAPWLVELQEAALVVLAVVVALLGARVVAAMRVDR